MRRCRSGQCVLARSFVFGLVAAGSTCVNQSVWWRHNYVSGDGGPTDNTLNADGPTANPEECARYALTDRRCDGGHLAATGAVRVPGYGHRGEEA